MSITLTKITPEQHASAVDWLTDALEGHLWTGSETSTWITRLTPSQAYSQIMNWYSGGWAQFVIDSEGVQL